MTAAPLSPFATPGEALGHQARLRPDAEALAFPLSGGRLTFAGWLEESVALARGLLDLGIAPGQHVGLLAENRREWPVVQLALALAGMVMVPLNSHLRQDDLAYGLDQSDSVALLLSRQFRSSDYLAMVSEQRERLTRLKDVICFDGAEGAALDYRDVLARGRSTDVALPEVSGGDAAALLYTSGTTGFPKGALLTHAGMLANSWGTAQRLGAAPGDRWTSIIPLFHCAGCVLNLLGSLQSGAAYVGVPAFDPVSRRAHLVYRHARSSGTRKLRPHLAPIRHLRGCRRRSGDPPTVRCRISHAAPGAGLWADGIQYPDRLSRT
jgi:fatty-acyl-CoA synthase